MNINKNKIQHRPAGNMVFGTRVLMEAIEAGKEIEKVLIRKGLQNERIRQLTDRLISLKIPFQKVPPEKLDRISRKNHQGVIGFLSPIRFASLDHIVDQSFSEGRDAVIFMLDRVTDVRNLGAIARSMEGMGADALVLPARGGALISGDAMKTSAGALYHLPVCRVADLKTGIQFLKESGFQILAITEKADTSLFEADLTGPVACILGSEEDGISPPLLQLADIRARIPMKGHIESLNVAVSAGIALYEIQRQRHRP